MTLFNPEDGTLSLGIEVGANSGHILDHVTASPATLSASSAMNSSAVVMNSSAHMMNSSAVVINSSAVAMNTPTVVMSNSNLPDGAFTYILRAAPPPTW